MARFVVVVLLLTLVLAPAVSAEPPSPGESPFVEWFDAIWSTFDRIFSWVLSIRSEPRRSGAYIDPSGILAPSQNSGAYIDPSGYQAASRKSGAYIDPSGIRTVRNPLGNPRLGEGATIR